MLTEVVSEELSAVMEMQASKVSEESQCRKDKKVCKVLFLQVQPTY